MVVPGECNKLALPRSVSPPHKGRLQGHCCYVAREANCVVAVCGVFACQDSTLVSCASHLPWAEAPLHNQTRSAQSTPPVSAMAAIVVARHQKQHQGHQDSPSFKNDPSGRQLGPSLHDPRVFRPVEQLQLNYRAARHPRLHRRNLAERLLFESKVLIGTARLVNQIMVFALLVLALRYRLPLATTLGFPMCMCFRS
eukprot:383887-Rhodomonas_salina.1